ncbi:MEDS domain-containing protein [Actinomadura barringtoniae]|uniref:MEDS domain-containing protein n=1 Tax=Actinomadura barringtoniae TaxID=1427535 RepID=A0A939PJ56_9ACTN|nr:MEDS domain-containing protein [Actinomadura barringtoniae]MBO2453615.1 MEDS domain-containing protein [Actinomadura barringtoniae]
MRHHGTCAELVGIGPHDHIGWVYSGPDEFPALARDFLATGAAAGERLMYVAEDPNASRLEGMDHLIDSGVLTVASIAEVYGASGVVHAAHQRTVFLQALAEAQAEGYEAIRVAADNTPLLSNDERFRAWLRWEMVADQLMSKQPVIGLCAFDRERVDIDRLRNTATLHPLLSSSSPVPQFRLYSDEGELRAEGDLDTYAVQRITWALPHLPFDTGVIIDLAVTTFLSSAVMQALYKIAQTGIRVTIRGTAEATRALRQGISSHHPHLSFVVS